MKKSRLLQRGLLHPFLTSINIKILVFSYLCFMRIRIFHTKHPHYNPQRLKFADNFTGI